MRHKLVVFLCFALVLLLGGFLYPGHLVPSAQAESRFRPMDVGNSPFLITLSQLLGRDQQERTLQMSVGLALRNQDELNALLQNLYDPSSPQYHQYLTVAQFTQEFGPADEQQAVVSYLAQQGFTVTQTYPNHLLVDFSGPESLAERVFGVTINSYQGPDGRDFFANSNSPTLPAYIAQNVTSLTGLDDASQFSHPPIVSQNTNQVKGSPQANNCPQAGSGSGSGGGLLGGGVAYIPSQLSTAYDYDGLHKAGLQGQGQTAGVFELDGYAASDIRAYTQCFGGGNVPLQNVVLDGFNGQPGAGAIEVELDVEAILGMAPNLSKLIVYEAPNTTQGYNDEFARIVSDRTPVISVSWGQCETAAGQQEAQQENTFFQEAAAQGQTILVAAGDSGSETCFEQTYDPSLVADDPAAQPYVTAVGGTTLSLNSDNSYQSEHVWNSGFFGGAGGGGLSQYWKQPSWQTGPGVQNSYSNGMREAPDVSLNADPATGYNVYCTVGSNCTGSTGGLPTGTSGGWLTVGGTSAAAPMWAAMIALTNQEAAQHGKGPAGFLNPLLYQIGASSHYNTDFHDITPPTDSSVPSNNDELGFNGGAYPVTLSYDMATGWGSFDAAKLAADLVAMGK